MPFTRDQIEDINKIVSTCVSKLVSDENFIKLVVTTVAETVTATVLDTLNQRNENHNEDVETLKKNIKRLEDKNKDAEHNIDNLEQYTRRNSLRIFGIKEDHNENLDDKVLLLFKNVLKEESIKVENLDRIHRVGKYQNGAVRAVIVKFVSYRQRDVIFRKKKLLKGSGVTIKEDLTSARVKLLKLAEQKFGFKNTWTRDGKIYVSSNNQIKMISSFEDINKIMQ